MVCRDGEILKLRVEGVPLGLLPDREYEEIPLQTNAGDMIVLYSDGIPDHLSPGRRGVRPRRLADVVRAHCHLSAQALIDAIFADLDRFNRERSTIRRWW